MTESNHHQLSTQDQLGANTLVRSTSDLYKAYGVGRVVKVRGDQAKVEFNPSVFMSPPYRSGNESVAAGAC
jgi:hypothetical protein